MAPIKFEEQIKDKLEKRTVSPSADAWSKLSQQLDAEDNRNKKSAFWWIGIAASIAALVMVSVSYFNNGNESTEIDEVIVNDKIENVITPNKEDTFITNDETNAEKQEVAVEQNNSKEQTEKNQKTSTLNQKKLIEKIPSQKSNTSVVKIENHQPLKQKDLEIDKTLQEAIIKTPEVEFNSVVSVVNEAKAENTVTDQQIDSLLKVANRELFMDKTIKKKSNVVNADALLQDVEDAMGQSFRTRVYETLKGGFKEVKKAVAQRND